MNKLAIAAVTVALAGFATGAFAEEPVVKAGAVGLMRDKDAFGVTLNNDTWGLAGRMSAGGTCVMQPGDSYEIIMVGVDYATVKRKLRARLARPNAATCPAHAIVRMPLDRIDADVKAAIADAAAKKGKGWRLGQKN